MKPEHENLDQYFDALKRYQADLEQAELALDAHLRTMAVTVGNSFCIDDQWYQIRVKKHGMSYITKYNKRPGRRKVVQAEPQTTVETVSPEAAPAVPATNVAPTAVEGVSPNPLGMVLLD